MLGKAVHLWHKTSEMVPNLLQWGAGGKEGGESCFTRQRKQNLVKGFQSVTAFVSDQASEFNYSSIYIYMKRMYQWVWPRIR